MEKYNSELARWVYHQLIQGSHGEFPITAEIIEWIITNFVYWYHSEVPWFLWKIQHLSVEGEILIRPTWEQVQSWVNNILAIQKQAA